MFAQKTLRIGLILILTLMFSFSLLRLGLPSSAQEEVPEKTVFVFSPQNPPTTTSVAPSVEGQIALDYVSETYGIPSDQLKITNEHRREYVELGCAFRAVTIFDSLNQRPLDLLIDLEDHTVVEDIVAIEQAEADAYQQKYGKMEKSLFDRLQKATDDELIEIAVWIAGAQRSEAELFAGLAARFPEARLALEQSGTPFDVEDEAVRMQIEQAYQAMLEEDSQVLVSPVVTYLQARGYAVTTYPGMPSVSAKLNKPDILELANRPDVGWLYLIEGPLRQLIK